MKDSERSILLAKLEKYCKVVDRNLTEAMTNPLNSAQVNEYLEGKRNMCRQLLMFINKQESIDEQIKMERMR